MEQTRNLVFGFGQGLCGLWFGKGLRVAWMLWTQEKVEEGVGQLKMAGHWLACLLICLHGKGPRIWNQDSLVMTRHTRRKTVGNLHMWRSAGLARDEGPTCAV